MFSTFKRVMHFKLLEHILLNLLKYFFSNILEYFFFKVLRNRISIKDYFVCSVFVFFFSGVSDSFAQQLNSCIDI